MSQVEDTTEGLEPEAPDVASDEQAEPEAPRYAGKFNDEAALEQGYLEAEKRGTQAAQEAAEYRRQLEEFQAQQAEEPEPQFDPWANLGSTMDEDTERQIAARVYQDPQGMMEWAQQQATQQQFGADIADRVFATWQQLQPFKAASWLSAHTATQSLAEQRAEVEALAAAQKQDFDARLTASALDLVKQNIPDFVQYKDRVVELFGEHQLPDDHPLLKTPEGMLQFTRQMYQIARGEEFDRQQAEAALEATTEKPAPGARAKTQTRSTASSAPVASGDPALQALLDATAHAQTLS